MSFTREDAQAILSGVRQTGWSPGYPTEGDLEIAQLIGDAAWAARLAAPFGPYRMIERESGQLIGGVGFLGPPDDTGSIEIGYGIAPEQRGRGLATEAVQGLLAFAWSHPSVRRVRASTEATNLASQRVLEKAGMTRTKTDADLLCYEILKPR